MKFGNSGHIYGVVCLRNAESDKTFCKRHCPFDFHDQSPQPQLQMFYHKCFLIVSGYIKR